MEQYLESAKTLFWAYVPNVIYAILLLAIGLSVVKKLVSFSKKMMRSKGVEETL
jgi:hypothetical protein